MKARCAALLSLIVAAAGLPSGAHLIVASQPAESLARPPLEFRAGGWLDGRKVVNGSAEEVGAASDAIVDRGTGSIEFLVVKTGTVLGMGGRAVAIPYGAFSWESGGERLVLSATHAQIERLPEFSAKSWSAMVESREGQGDRLSEQLGQNQADPYSGSLDSAKPAHVEGEVSKVERVRRASFGEHTQVTITAKDGSVKRVALGPSWFIAGGAVTPMRGDHVEVETLALARDPDQLSVATKIKAAGREFRLRDSEGLPAWTLKTSKPVGGSATTYWRYILASTLRGVRVDCRGEECGKIHELILERGSGDIAFVSIDPNQAFLGISDTKRLVPWSVCSVTLDEMVRIDASKEMILASPETPAKVEDLGRGDRANGVYEAFKVATPKFEAAKRVPLAAASTSDAWSVKGPVIASIEPGTERTLRGRVTEVTEVAFDGGIQPAKAIKIREGMEEKLVLLGPAWYMDKQKLAAQPGDTVEVSVSTTHVLGGSYLLARSLTRNGERTVILDSGGKPAWDRK